MRRDYAAMAYVLGGIAALTTVGGTVTAVFEAVATLQRIWIGVAMVMSSLGLVSLVALGAGSARLVVQYRWQRAFTFQERRLLASADPLERAAGRAVLGLLVVDVVALLVLISHFALGVPA